MVAGILELLNVVGSNAVFLEDVQGLEGGRLCVGEIRIWLRSSSLPWSSMKMDRRTREAGRVKEGSNG